VSLVDSVYFEQKKAWVISKDRLLLVFWVLVYGCSIIFGHEKYLAVEQIFWGYEQPHYDFFTLMVAFVMLLFSTAF